MLATLGKVLAQFQRALIGERSQQEQFVNIL
jgi:hypothetical protein